MRALLVEDDNILAEFVAKGLGEAGFAVDRAGDAERGLTVALERPPDIVIEIPVASKTDTAYLKVGAPFRSFKRVQYAEFQLNSRWWLGRKIGAAASYEQLTGPLVAPSSGLAFAYYDTLGAVTANPAAVGSVAFTLRTESFKQTYAGASYAYQRDSLTTKVVLRR